MQPTRSMKLDGDTVLCHGNVDRKSDHKGVLREIAEPIQFSCSAMEKESFEKDSVFCVDKSVMEPELPELVVCYKENTYHVVKDICVDEGVPSKDRFLFDTDEDEQQLCTFLISEDKHSEVGLEKGDPDMQIPELLKSSTKKENLAMCNPVTDDLISSNEKGSRNEFFLEHDLIRSIPVGGIEQGAVEKGLNGPLKEIFSLGELLSMAAMGVDRSQLKSLHNSVDIAEPLAQRSLEKTILTRSSDADESENVNEQDSLVSSSSVCKAKKSDFGCEAASMRILGSNCASKDSDHRQDSHLKSPPKFAAEESQNDSKEETQESRNSNAVSEPNIATGDEFSTSKLETKSSTADSNSAAPAAEGYADARNSSRPEGSGTEACSSQLQYCQGESSFSAAGPVSGLITYSGPIAYSGSLSLRSDSSTTSTRSFAFPILQSEWNSSPVRMVKAEEGRCIRRHRDWRQAILCCRF